MAKSLHARLVAYRPFGARIGILAMPVSFSASMLHDDDGAISIEYSLLSGDAQAFDRKLTDGLEIAVEVSDGTGYVEPDNARYVITGRSGKTDDRTRTVTYSGQSIGWLLSKAENNDSSHLLADGDNKGKRPFYSSNPGTILKTLLDENRQRGGIATGLTLGFDTAKDSAGAAWAKKYTLYYSLGTDLQTILSSLVNGGGCDWRTSARALKLWNADSTSLSRDLSKSIVLQLARDISEAPFEESIADLASTILVEGDNDLLFRMDNPAAPTPWGKWESYSSQGGVSDKATAQAFMQSTLDDAARVRGQYTRDLIVNDVDWLPLVDYHAGDWITAPTVNHGEKVRVREIDLSMRQNEGLSASIALNDIKYDASVRQAKKIKGITGGAALAGSESGTTASSDHDHRVPKAPQGLIVGTDAYLDATGYARGLATVKWAAVTQATDSTAIEISSYRVEWRRHVDGAPWRYGGVTDGLQLGIGNLDCGTVIEVRVRAIPTYSDQPGEWSEIVVATVESDVTPCSVPSKPVLSSKLGVVTVHWDGRTSDGGAMESDFDHLVVGSGSGPQAISQFDASVVGMTDLLDSSHEPGDVIYYALASVDHAGNQSEWSETASIEVASAVTAEQVERIQKDLAANTEILKDNSAKLAQAQKDITANRTAQAETAKQLDSAKSDITANKTAIDAANESLKDNSAKLEQAQKDIVQAKSDITSITGDVEQAKADILANAEQAEQAQKTADAAATAAGTAQDTADKAQAAAGTAQSTADAAKTAAASATTTAEQAKKVADAADKAAESAKTTATNAETLANTANDTADAAKSDAADAKSVAASASSVATQSKATADSAAQAATDAAGVARQADSAAAAAAGIANGKADVLIQSSTPDSSMCKAATLWIDTTGGANTPKRWTGSAWSAVTDKAATDAADTAVKANDAAKTAQSTADKAATAAANAQSQANQAQAAAVKAQTTADGKNLIYRGPDEPAHDGLKPGDMWWRTQAYWTRWEGDANASPSDLADFYTYWQGEPNASPSVLVPLSDRVVEVLTWNGTSFEPFDLVANNILAAGSVVAKHLAADSVTAEKVKANAITVDKLAANSVTTEKLVADAVTAAKLAADSVTARNITALAVTTDKLAANAVTTAKLKVTEDMAVALLNVHRIQADDIVSGAITTDKLAANSVNADKIAANSVNADKIVSGAITADKLAANSVTAVKLASRQITADKIAYGTITGSEIKSRSIRAEQLYVTGGSDYCPNPQLALDGSNIYDGKRAPGGFGTFDKDGYSPPSGGKNRYLDGRDMMFAYETAFNILPGETYTVTCEARRYCGSLSLQAGLWCTDNGTTRTSTPYTWQYVGAKSLGKCSLNTDWSRYSWTVTIPDGAPFNKAQIYFQINQDASNPSTAWVVGNIHCRRAADAQLIVDGAITASKISADAIDGRTLTGNKIVGATITSTANNRTITLADGVTKFSYNGSQVGILTCSSSGVYLHYVTGGKEYGITMGSGGASIVTSDGSQIAIGSGGFGVTCSDGSNMSLSKSGFNVNCGLGKLYVNGSGLRFTQDSLGYGLSMSSSGWSLKWAGNHTLATGPKAGALYIDGAEIKTSANS